jgi:hypothetical protein
MLYAASSPRDASVLSTRGIVYLCNGRNLVPLILAHGLTDSLSLVAIYLGVVQLL